MTSQQQVTLAEDTDSMLPVYSRNTISNRFFDCTHEYAALEYRVEAFPTLHCVFKGFVDDFMTSVSLNTDTKPSVTDKKPSRDRQTARTPEKKCYPIIHVSVGLITRQL